MNVFDYIGPIMVGPSSSHTAGAARIGNIARLLFGKVPLKAEIVFFGSFSKTYKGHGTDRAVVGGLLGFKPDDIRIRDSFLWAEKENMQFSIITSEEAAAHPNTVKITIENQEKMHITGQSTGGGIIKIVEINDSEVSFSADFYTTVVFNEDIPGVVSEVSGIFAKYSINIANMKVFRNKGTKSAIMVIESDQQVKEDIFSVLRQTESIKKAVTINPF